LTSVDRAASLIVTIEENVPGLPRLQAKQIGPLSFGPDCNSAPRTLADLQKRYPVGAEIAAFSRRWTDSSADLIVVEQNQGGFVTVVPTQARRTPDGDLAFSFVDPNNLDDFSWFEYQRAVLRVPSSRLDHRFSRLLNIAHFGGLRYSTGGREFLERLISESPLTNIAT
jgi:hypothetical protein